jgi:D-alanine-D-alanine ligase-like ATP-grasp enzyme
MGLLEKRAIKNFHELNYPVLIKEINTIAGYPIEFEVNWDSLMVDELSHLYEEGFTKVYFTPIINAFKEITIDDLGKEALKMTVKKIIIKNEQEFYSAASAYVLDKNGILTIDLMPTTNVDSIEDRSSYLATYLMKHM